ncbi:helix-turn-helix domain-containing protein [Amycolatopsis anabasis]|uniref:helix-turn-helix domain-containing protein n=1 Tax=Amycolatopsis anabasis TaxID=1840409 RepID=UPI00131B9E62|nr:helix-turn-helix domain-containing protein [Amycolatopsis anabasis]
MAMTVVQSVFDDLLAHPERLDAIVADQVARVRAEVPEYRGLPDADQRAGNRSIVVAALGQLRAGRLPDEAELREINAFAADRARRGISIAAVLAAYRIAAQGFWDTVAGQARRRGADPESLLHTMQLLWQWLDRVTVAAATAHREVELRSAREDEQRIGDALRALLVQPAAGVAGQQHLLQLGLAPDGKYGALRGRLAPGATVSALRESMPEGGLVAVVVHQDVLGLLSGPIDVDPGFGTFGVGPWRGVDELPGSYLAAGRALAAALRLSLPGAHSMETLRLAGVAATDDEMTRILTDRLLAPLRAKGGYGQDIWQSVRRYLEHGMRVDETAASLHVHANTLRHRLAHFTELTGADLRDPADIAEIWWLTRSSHDQRA